MATNDNDPVILGAVRTPFGKFGGGLLPLGAVDLGAHVIREAISRSDLPPEDVTHTIMGCVVQAGLGQVPSRQASFKAGPGPRSDQRHDQPRLRQRHARRHPGRWLIRLGHHEVIVAGGMESMSNAPLLPEGRAAGACVWATARSWTACSMTA